MDDFRRQLGIAVRWLPLVLIGAIAAGAVAYVMTSDQPKVYEATAKLIVDPGPSPTTQDLAVAEEQTALYAGLVQSRVIAEAVIQRLGLDSSPDSLLRRISTSTDPESLSLAIEARDEDPEAARLLVLTFGEEMRQRVRDRLITNEVRDADRAIRANQAAIGFSQRRLNNLIAKPNKTARDRIDVQALFSQISALQSDMLFLQRSSSAFVRNRLNWFEEPSTPSSPVEPRPMYWTLLAIVAGGLLGMATGFVIEYLNSKVRDERDLEAATGFDVLGSISEKRGDIRRGGLARLVMLSHPTAEAAESYRSLRARMLLGGGSMRTLLVASADRSDGRSVVAANVALAYAEAGHTVILVDADHRSPRLHSLFGVPNDRGLSDLHRDEDAPLDQVTVPTAHPRLRLMPTGPSSVEASELLRSSQVPRLLGRLLQVADMIVMDGPSLVANLEAAMLATHLQACLLVIPGGSRSDTAAKAVRALQSDDAHLAGAVLYRTERGSHRRSPTGSAIRLPSPGIAIPPVRTTEPQPPMDAKGPSTEPPGKRPASGTLSGTSLYRMVRGSRTRAATREPGSANGNGATPASSAGIVEKTDAAATRPAAPRPPTGQGPPAERWPDDPRQPIAVPVERPMPVASQPIVGPYAGEFRPDAPSSPQG